MVESLLKAGGATWANALAEQRQAAETRKLKGRAAKKEVGFMNNRFK